MASGVYDGGATSVSYIKPRLVWESTPNAATNTSTVTVTLYAINTSSGTGYIDGTGAWQIIIDGQYSGKIEAYVKVQAGQDWVRVVSWTTTVAHDADGSRTIKIQATGGISSSSQWYSTKCSTDIVLDTIVKSASTATVNSPMAVDGVNVSTVTINAAASGLYHKVYWHFGTYWHEEYTAGASASFTVPTWWLEQAPTTTSGTATITVETYADSGYTSLIGSAYTTYATWTVPASMVPNVAAGWVNMVPAQTNTNAPQGIYIAGISKAQVVFDTSKVQASPGATIAEYRITYGGVNYYSPFVTPLLPAGNLQVIATVVDSRGRSASETLTGTVYSYANPTLSGVEVYRSTVNGTPSSIGTNIYVKANANVSTLDGAIGYSMQAQVKIVGGEYGFAYTMTSGERLLIDGMLTTGNYYVLITLTDGLGNSTSIETLVPAGEDDTSGDGPSYLGMHLREGGNGAGFGSKADEEGYMKVAYTNGLKIVNGKLTIGETALSEAQLKALLSML